MSKVFKFVKSLFLNDYVYCSLFVGVLMYLISVIPINEELTKPFTEALSDFEITDLGFTDLRANEPKADTNIVIVNIGRAGNAELAAMLNQINQYNPAVVGVNEILKKSGDGFADTLLQEALKNTKELVYACKLQNFSDSLGTWNDIELPDSMFIYFQHEENSFRYATIGFENMFTHDKDFKTTRHFYPTAKFRDNIPLNFFATELVDIISPEKVKKFESRAKDYEVINYTGNYDKFITLDGAQVINGEFDPSSVKNKIVIFGYLGESLMDEKFWDDYKYYTPLNKNYAGKTFPDMFETVIYANITSQILKDNHINVASLKFDIFINILICFLNVVLFSKLFHSAAVWWDLFSLIITFAEILIILMSTVFVFSFYGFEMNLNPSIIFILVLGSFLELYYGLFKVALQRLSVKFMIVQEADKRDKLKSTIKGSTKNIIDELRNINPDEASIIKSQNLKDQKNQFDL